MVTVLCFSVKKFTLYFILKDYIYCIFQGNVKMDASILMSETLFQEEEDEASI